MIVLHVAGDLYSANSVSALELAVSAAVTNPEIVDSTDRYPQGMRVTVSGSGIVRESHRCTIRTWHEVLGRQLPVLQKLGPDLKGQPFYSFWRCTTCAEACA